MNETVQKFLDEVKGQKVKQLMGIDLDLVYFKDVIAQSEDEDTLRKKLEKENKKRIINAKGELMKDDRDLELIEDLKVKIDTINGAKEQINKLEHMRKQIVHYLSFVQNPDSKLVKQLEKVSKL